MNITKDVLVNELLNFKIISDISEMDNRIKRLEAAIERSDPDKDFMYGILALRANREEHATSNFDNCREIAKPIFAWLQGKPTWSGLELVIISMVIGYTETYKHSDALAKQAIKAAEYAFNNEAYKKVLISAIQFNMTFRLLRAKYFDITDPDNQKSTIDDIQGLFDRYMADVRSSLDEKHHKTPLLMLDIREALFNHNCEGIIQHLETLRKSADKHTYAAMRSECIEFIANLHGSLDTHLFNLLVGSRIQHYRKLRLKTTAQLAEHLETLSNVVNDVEAGRRGASLERICNIANFLDVSVEDLIGHRYITKPIAETVDPRAPKLLKLWDQVRDKDRDYILEMLAVNIKHLDKLDGIKR